jgi:hypothetical protein
LTKNQDPAVATPLQSAAAWVETVRKVEDETVQQAGWRRKDAGGRTDLGLGLYGLAKETAKAGLTIAEAAGKIDAPEDAERWAAWADLERRYLRELKNRGKRCPQEVELARAKEPMLPEGITRVVLAGVADASPLAVTALEEVVFRYIPAAQTLLSVELGRMSTSVAVFIGWFVIFWTLAPPEYRGRAFPKWPGALVTTLWWTGALALLPPALSLFGSYALTYGSLAGVIVALLFFWIVGFGLVIGAHLNAALANPAIKEPQLNAL